MEGRVEQHCVHFHTQPPHQGLTTATPTGAACVCIDTCRQGWGGREGWGGERGSRQAGQILSQMCKPRLLTGVEFYKIYY